EPDAIGVERRVAERSERLPGQARLEVLDADAQCERQPVGRLNRHRRVDVEGEDLRLAGDAVLITDRIVVVLRGEAERDVDADPEDGALVQPACRIPGWDEGSLRD